MLLRIRRVSRSHFYSQKDMRNKHKNCVKFKPNRLLSKQQKLLTELSWFVVLCMTRPTLWSQADSPWPSVCSPHVLSFSQSYSTSGCAASLHRLQTQSPLRHIHKPTNRNKYTKMAGKRPKGQDCVAVSGGRVGSLRGEAQQRRHMAGQVEDFWTAVAA